MYETRDKTTVLLEYSMSYMAIMKYLVTSLSQKKIENINHP